MLKFRAKSVRRVKQGGVTLIEILVSLLLLSFGLLSLAGMQAYSLAAQKNASNRAIASMLANELAELIRLNQKGFADGKYDVSKLTDAALPSEAVCEFPNCTSTDTLAEADLTSFRRLVRNHLPKGGVELSRPGGSAEHAEIWIVWEEAAVLNTTKGGSEVSTEVHSENCPATAKSLSTLPRCLYMKVQL